MAAGRWWNWRTAFNKMAADLEHAETLRNNLMADVSHELRTPLTVLEGNLRAGAGPRLRVGRGRDRQPLRSDPPPDPTGERPARAEPWPRRSSSRSNGSRPTWPRWSPRRCRPSSRWRLRRACAWQNDTAQLPELLVDSIRIRQVLFNLLANALRHTPAGGEVHVHGTAGAGEVRVAVQDTGDGLEPEQLAVVFDRFYRATNRAAARQAARAGPGDRQGDRRGARRPGDGAERREGAGMRVRGYAPAG